MSRELIIQTNGPYLRVILPDLEDDWTAVWRALDYELEDGTRRVEIVAPCYSDRISLEAVHDLVDRLDELGVDSIVEWQGELLARTATG